MPVRLMLVDDAEDARFLVRVIVEEDSAIEVVAEADGAETALERAAEAAPDVVLLDAMMPRTDGYELAPLLRERLPDVRLVLLTAHVDDVVQGRASEAGIDRVLGKDEFDSIAAVVRELGDP